MSTTGWIQIDNAAGSMWEDWESAQKFRLDTIQYVQYCLGLAPSNQEYSESTNPIIRAFDVIGFAIRDSCSLSQRKMVYDEMNEFMKQSEQEQRLRLNNDSLPSVDEFWSYRLGASAVFICLAINEYSYGDMDLPTAVFEDPDMKEIWQLTNIIISAVNDMLSLKKEIARDAIDSVIPIMYVQLGSVEAAMDKTVEFVVSMIQKFDEAEARLLTRYCSDENLQKQLWRFVDGAKYYCTGNLIWR
ncbi:conserved hypothetical protein [Talaromyces stipitatus ATCC 10500]|uniref:Terpene synthase n=1 Tax=Talaromyces stipitatus (strain ATCC 10500 / CBS 375.48 / QM 6759 / NRRL 1006) TaxID=441959 RepID=B8LZP3_TALSN|nr:uncharacterized protein TSTA_097150 [Talaromyces stipitatus ATCC 10500]EED22466.1 conserved hypothetical protein [Talaromyces stipitatus ATCC 10500]